MMRTIFKILSALWMSASALLLWGCATDDGDTGTPVYQNGSYTQSDQQKMSYEGYWQYNEQKQEKAELTLMSNNDVVLSCPPCHTLIELAVPAEHREEALGSIVCDPLKLTFQPYATNDASAYLMAAAGKHAFQVSYDSRDHVVSFEVDADTNGLFDSVHQLFYVLLFPKNICIDNQQVGSGDTPSPIVFNPIARKK